MRFEFATANRIVFGVGTAAGATELVRGFGQRPLIVTGRDLQRAAPLVARLTAAKLDVTRWSVGHEPTTDDITRGVAVAREARCDVVVGLGGGSAIDSAKAIAALLTNDGELTDYLEIIGRAQPLHRPAAPCIAIPTTAGTGAEVTRNAVLASPAHRVKVSLRSPLMLPRVAIVDPELTYDLPPLLTATTGLDALTQLIEPYVSSRANPLTDGICIEGLRRAARSLRVAVTDGRDVVAREEMAFASLCGGLALTNAGLGAVHGFAGPIGGAFPAAHGAICAALLPHVVAVNVRALRERRPDSDALRRYGDVARLLTGRPQATADDAVEWLAELVAELRIPPLAASGVTAADVSRLIEAAAKASSMQANPLPLTSSELDEILRRALGD